MGIVIIIRT